MAELTEAYDSRAYHKLGLQETFETINNISLKYITAFTCFKEATKKRMSLLEQGYYCLIVKRDGTKTEQKVNLRTDRYLPYGEKYPVDHRATYYVILGVSLLELQNQISELQERIRKLHQKRDIETSFLKELLPTPKQIAEQVANKYPIPHSVDLDEPGRLQYEVELGRLQHELNLGN
jgi:hypothetical protein